MKRAQETMAARRRHLAMTQVEFARLLGVHPVTVAHWEGGRSKPTPWQWAISAALVLSPRNRELKGLADSAGVPCALAAGLEHLVPKHP